MTSSPMASSASARSTGGASGAPPSYRLKRLARVGGFLRAIDRLGPVGVLAHAAREVEALERELDGAGALAVVGGTEAVADLVVELGLPQHRQSGEEVARRHLLAGGDHRAGLDRLHEQAEVEAAQVGADGL